MAEWILCKERKPKYDNEVIVSIRETIYAYYSDTYDFTSVGRYDCVYDRWEVGNMYRTDIVAWMPLPEPLRH